MLQRCTNCSSNITKKKKNNEIPPISESSYRQYFHEELNFGFVKPRTDVCDFCFENRFNTENVQYHHHKEGVDKYSILKKSMLNDEKSLRMEFDFGQNFQYQHNFIAACFGYIYLILTYLVRVNAVICIILWMEALKKEQILSPICCIML